MAPVRAALMSVKGVTRARVTLENHEAVVTFDPKETSVAALIKAVGEAEGTMTSNQYSAKVKEPPQGSS